MHNALPCKSSWTLPMCCKKEIAPRVASLASSRAVSKDITRKRTMKISGRRRRPIWHAESLLLHESRASYIWLLAIRESIGCCEAQGLEISLFLLYSQSFSGSILKFTLGVGCGCVWISFMHKGVFLVLHRGCIIRTCWIMTIMPAFCFLRMFRSCLMEMHFFVYIHWCKNRVNGFFLCRRWCSWCVEWYPNQFSVSCSLWMVNWSMTLPREPSNLASICVNSNEDGDAFTVEKPYPA